jgi:hypothetical protein
MDVERYQYDKKLWHIRTCGANQLTTGSVGQAQHIVKLCDDVTSVALPVLRTT